MAYCICRETFTSEEFACVYHERDIMDIIFPVRSPTKTYILKCFRTDS